VSEDLFGNELPDQPAPAAAPKVKPGNNMDTVIKVLDRAMGDGGYVLVGTTGQPHRVGENKRLTPCIYWETAVIHDLIRSSMLTVGAQKWMDTRHGRKPCQSILVPRTTRLKVTRWKALKPLHSKGKGAA
jgi:hypothetical protein